MTDQQIDEFLEMLAKSPTSARDMVRGLFAANEAKAAPAFAKASATSEPTGMPPAPEPDIHYIYIGLGWKPATAQQYAETHRQKCAMHSTIQLQTYGEQCWKAGYKHGAWGDKPAVNQQLTTEFDEREAFEREMSCEEVWGHRSFKKKPDGRYANWCVDLMWDVWQARAAMAKGAK